MPAKLIIGFLAAAAASIALGAAQPEKLYDMTIVNGALPAEQRLIKVTKDDMVRLRVTSDAPGEFHLHGYRVEMKLAPGKPSEISFKAYATGRYTFGWHGAAEKAQTEGHHGPEFAVLEVYPK